MESNGLNIEMMHLENLSLLHQAFIGAFSDYQVNLEQDFVSFSERLQKIGVDVSISPVAWVNEQISGFIIQAVGEYKGIKTAYNGGTGVIPNCRGQGISKKLYFFAFKKLQELGVKQCLLEVIENNKPAINVYEQLGFTTTRIFHSYRGIPKKKKINTDVQLLQVKNRLPNWNLYQSFFGFDPCWQNSTPAIIRNFKNELIIEAIYRTKIVGFVIFEPLKSKITQLACHPNFRRQGIGILLLRAASQMVKKRSIALLNIDASHEGMNTFLIECGMEKIITQKEMIKHLP